MNREEYLNRIHQVLTEAVAQARDEDAGNVATYIPELASVEPDQLSASIYLSDGSQIHAGDFSTHRFTLQSVAKLVVLIGLLEEYGEEKIFSWINAEPSGQHFSSVSQVDRYGPIPANPMVNAGAIALCGRIPGDAQARQLWLDRWMEKLFGHPLLVDQKVFHSEKLTGDRNRSIAYLLRSNKVLIIPAEEALDTYFRLCSYEADITASARLPMILANGGLDPEGKRVISELTSNAVVALMATCGMYDESGMHLVKTGMPAKSGVSGLIVAVATGRGGFAVSSPKLNYNGGSVRGHHVLNSVSKALDWHFAAPWGYLRLEDEQF
jgi:glutaminase